MKIGKKGKKQNGSVCPLWVEGGGIHGIRFDHWSLGDATRHFNEYHCPKLTILDVR